MTLTGIKQSVLATLTLFSSLSTLLCCALPALLVALGAGSVMAGLVTTLPQLTLISRHKPAVFITAGLLLTLSAAIMWRNRYAPCPIDPVQARACMRLKKINRVIFGFSILAYIVGAFFAFLAPFFMT